MAQFKKDRFDSNHQDWETPQDFFDQINREFCFTLDAAASSENTKVKENFLSASDDSFTQNWGANIVWLNPPYGDQGRSLSQWVAKAYSESILNTTTVMLIPAQTNTKWFHDYCFKKGEVRFIYGRLKFKNAKHTLPRPLCLVIFRSQESRKKTRQRKNLYRVQNAYFGYAQSPRN